MTWARGCGSSGWISPFGGNAKLPWNLEWAAQWSLFGVTIEPGGKDLSTAGGSRDRSDAIAREVFEREPPLNVPYEFLNIGGKKMSTSKGHGAAAHTIAEVIPPEQLRFLFLRPRPNQAIEFDPDGTDAVPRLFDEFDKFAAATAGREVKGEIAAGYEATFRYSLLDPNADVAAEAAAFRPPFAHLALLVQIPGVDVAARVETEKGSPLTERETAILRRTRRGRAGAGSTTYAPERRRLADPADELPAAAREMTDDMRALPARRRDRRRDAAAVSRRRGVAEPPVRRGSRPGHADESRPSRRSISRSSAATTARAPAGCSHARQGVRRATAPRSGGRHASDERSAA